jgi:hypothetical protein
MLGKKNIHFRDEDRLFYLFLVTDKIKEAVRKKSCFYILRELKKQQHAWNAPGLSFFSRKIFNIRKY